MSCSLAIAEAFGRMTGKVHNGNLLREYQQQRQQPMSVEAFHSYQELYQHRSAQARSPRIGSRSTVDPRVRAVRAA